MVQIIRYTSAEPTVPKKEQITAIKNGNESINPIVQETNADMFIVGVWGKFDVAISLSMEASWMSENVEPGLSLNIFRNILTAMATESKLYSVSNGLMYDSKSLWMVVMLDEWRQFSSWTTFDGIQFLALTIG